MTAGSSRRGPARWRSMQFAARFVRPPGNQLGHWMPRDRSTEARYGVVHCQPRSRETASQYHSRSSTERRWSASSEDRPWRAMKRAMRVRAAAAGSGRQTISVASMGFAPLLVGPGRFYDRRRGECHPLAAALEELDGSLVRLGLGAGGERAEVARAAGLRVALARVQAVLAGLQLADH